MHEMRVICDMLYKLSGTKHNVHYVHDVHDVK